VDDYGTLFVPWIGLCALVVVAIGVGIAYNRVHTETEPNLSRTLKDFSNMNFKGFSRTQK
jgi:hypothetical protein